MRNLLAHAGRRGRGVVAAFIGAAFAQGDAASARTQWRHGGRSEQSTVARLASSDRVVVEPAWRHERDHACDRRAKT